MTDERERLREAIAEALYDEYRVGCMSDSEYKRMWHELGDNARAGFRQRAAALLTQAQEPVGYVVIWWKDDPLYGPQLRDNSAIFAQRQNAEIEAASLAQIHADMRFTVEPAGVEAVASAPALDGSLEGVIGFDVHEAIWGPLGEDEVVRPEAWKAAAAVMDILRAGASAAECDHKWEFIGTLANSEGVNGVCRKCKARHYSDHTEEEEQ